MLPTNSLRIGYVNVRGLDLKTHEVCNSYIHLSHFDLLCVSETWFTNRSTYLGNSFLLAESDYPNQPHHTRRQDGGLILLISPSQRSNITLTYRSRYSFVIEHGPSNAKIAFTYLPPSLSDEEIHIELSSIGPVNTLIGDLNTRLGAQSGDSMTSAPARRAVISSFTTLHSLSYVRNTNSSITSRTDHIYSDMQSIEWEYVRDLEFQTDHGLMHIQVNLQAPQAQTTCQLGSPRFNFNPLNNPIFRADFVAEFDASYAATLLLECESALQSCCHSMILPSTAEAQSIIDLSYNSLIETITNSLSRNLTSYDAHAVKSKPDPIIKESGKPPESVVQTIRLFKRSQRSHAARSPIESSDPAKTPLNECTHYYRNQYHSDESIPQPERQNDIEFGLRFSNKKIKETIKKYSLVKAMGPDGIHTIVFKALVDSDLFLQSLSALFQLYASTGLVPTSWSTCNLHLLIKKHDQPRIASNTRPIALSPILRRIFERLLMREWESQASNPNEESAWMDLDEGQAGFRRGYSTLSHLILSDEISRHENPFSVFLDLKGAFDAVSWAKLNDLLIARNCPSLHKNLILSLICRPAELLLSVNQSERVSIYTRKGVFQGGGISAFIFAIYIDPLARELNLNCPPHRPLALLYADDVQIKPKSSSEGQDALDKCSRYAVEYMMKWSIPKCAIVGECTTDLILSGSSLPRAEEYTYLGATHRADGVDWRSTFTKSTAKQSRLLTSLSDRNWHPRTRLIIYRTFIRPITEYTAALTWIWAGKNLSSRSDLIKLMETSHQTAMKWIYNRRRHIKLMDYMSGFGPWTHRMECLRAGLVFCLKKMHDSNPLRFARAFYLVSTSRNFILPDCFKSTYATAFWKDNGKEKVSWFTWKRRKLKALQQVAATSSATISYYSPVINTDCSSPIFQLDWKLFDLALNWRSNNALLHRTCACSHSFNRSHLSCVLDGNPLFDSTLAHGLFQTACKNLTATSRDNHHLTVLDHLLNRRQHQEFSELFQALASALDAPPQI